MFMRGGAEGNNKGSDSESKNTTKGCKVKARVVEHYVLPSDFK